MRIESKPSVSLCLWAIRFFNCVNFNRQFADFLYRSTFILHVTWIVITADSLASEWNVIPRRIRNTLKVSLNWFHFSLIWDYFRGCFVPCLSVACCPTSLYTFSFCRMLAVVRVGWGTIGSCHLHLQWGNNHRKLFEGAPKLNSLLAWRLSRTWMCFLFQKPPRN